MAKITIPLSDTFESITYPITMEIVRDLFEITGIDKTTPILFTADNGTTYQPGSTLTAKLEGRENNTFSHSARIQIEIDEDYEPVAANENTYFHAQEPLIFSDEVGGINIRPIKTTTNLTIRIRYRAKTITQAQKWRDAMRSNIKVGMATLQHSPTYFYVLPNLVFTMLSEFHRLQENVAGYDRTFNEYVNTHFTARKTIQTTLKGSEPEHVITEDLRRVIGRFDFTAQPEKAERDGEGDAYIISFSYNVTYEKPISLAMVYPIVIHNQLLASRYRPTRPNDTDETHALSRTVSTTGMALFEPNYQINKWKAQRGISVPDFDDFIPSQVIPSSLRIFTGLVLVDPESEILMNLGDLGDYVLSDRLLNLIKKESPWIIEPYNSILNVTIYRNFDIFDYSLGYYDVDNLANVIMKKPFSLRDFYHVRLSVISDLEKLSKDALERLRGSAKDVKAIVNAIAPGIEIDKELSRLEKDGPVKRVELEKIIQLITPHPSRSDPSNRIGYNTVQGFIVRSQIKKPSN